MNSNVLGLRSGILTKPNSDNSNLYINFSFDRRYNTNLLYNTNLKYNPFTDTLSVGNISGLIDKVEVNNNDDNANYKLVFSDGSNNLLDNNHLFYHPFFQQLKVESNNSQTYQLLLKNSGQSSGIQIKGAPALTQYEANITHYLDILKIQNTGSDTEIQQVGSGTINIYNANGSLTLNGSGNIVASGIYAGNGSLLTSLTTSNLNGLVQNNQLQNDSITIGSTEFNLGDTLTTISGITSITSTTFVGDLSGNASTSTKSVSIDISNDTSSNTDFRLIFTDAAGSNRILKCDTSLSGIKFNPYTSSLTGMSSITSTTFVGALSGNATTATTSTNSINIYLTQKTTFLSGERERIFFNDLQGTPPYVQAKYNEELYYNGFDREFTSPNLKLTDGIANIGSNIKFDDTGDSYINTGNFAIGTTTPHCLLDLGTSYGSGDSARKLALYHDGTYFAGFGMSGNTMEFSVDRTTGQPPLMVLKGSGNLGIGISNPAYKLHIFSTSTSIAFIESTTNASYMESKNGSLGQSYFGTDGNGLINIDAGATIVASSSGKNIYIAPGLSAKMTITSAGNVGIGFTNPQNKLEVLGDIKCGNPANSLTALDIDINSSHAYGILIGGWSSGGRTASNATIEMSSNLHIDSPSSGPGGAGNIYLNYYNAAQATYIRNRVDISDKRIKKDIVEIETPDQFNDTFEIIKKVGSYKYKYRDTYRENDLDQYGFIAQEVLENYPVASKLAGDNLYLPNIMKTLNFTYEVGDDNEYTFNIEGYDLDVNIKYLFYAFREGVEQFDYLENIKPTTNNTFTYTPTIIKNEESPTYIKLVLVGTYTDDKLGVSKDKLFQLGFAGVRGLITENETLKSRIDILEENQKKIIQKLNELINSDGWFKGLPP